MTSSKILFVISYDISNDRRRKRISDKLLDYGRRIQYSVFECLVEPEKIDLIISKLMPEMDLDEDSVRVYRITANTDKNVLVLGNKDEIYEDQNCCVL